MLRKLIVVIVALALLWGGYWWGVAAAVNAALGNWADMRRSEGWSVAMSDPQQSGYPAAVKTQISTMSLARIDGRTALAIPEIALNVPLSAPLSPTMLLPAQSVTITSPNVSARLDIEGAQVKMALKPSRLAEVQQITLNMAPWQIARSGRPLLSSQGTVAAMVQNPDNDRIYAFNVDVDGLTLAELMRQNLRLPPAWPETFETLELQMTVAFDRPFDRRSQPGDRPQPRRIELERAAATWGAIDLLASADLTVDTSGTPEGTLSLRADNWKAILDMLQATRIFDPRLRDQIENTLGLVAGLSGSSDTLDIEITFADGRMSIGFFPLGPAPKIILR
ncbi:hypothetical protein C1J03_04375 [Sulfitobacter sp. SK012]|uniref:DUF2125 domain-containing protein n=1 Tax=Sulfitobacter sp. SK012 TaxID=1389005 RepID=UPI000E0B8C3C|nr:DUF2125 domain-containing protein [Sulfitobacter sp. SK012]AXI45341.1 hypothetical protein C1J03_04375 [Sulfitobacter sp. SK012]